MDHQGNCGAVLAVENVVHVAALARDVMEKTPHVMLSGKGAEEFARTMDYPEQPLLTDQLKAIGKMEKGGKLQAYYQYRKS